MYRMLAATAEFQRDLIIANTREGRSGRGPRTRTQRRAQTQTHPAAGAAGPAALRRQRENRRRDRRDLHRVPHHHLRRPQQRISRRTPASPQTPSPHHRDPRDRRGRRPLLLTRSPMLFARGLPGSNSRTSRCRHGNASCAPTWYASARPSAHRTVQTAETNPSPLKLGGGNAKTSPPSDYTSTAPASSANNDCVACQPHEQPLVVECDRCGDGPLITGLPATTPPGQWPPTSTRWLHNNGWRT